MSSMELAGYLTAIGRLLAAGPGEQVVFTTDLKTEGLRQALREYEQGAAPLLQSLTVTVTGQQQSLAGITDLVELVAVAWPWEANPAGLRYQERVVRWRPTEPGKIWIEDGEPKAGDSMAVYYRRRQTVKSLDGAAVTTVPVEHESLVTLGAAGWTAELAYRQAAAAVKGPTAEQIKRMYTWSYLRLNEFRAGIMDLQRVMSGQVIRPAWGNIGL